MTLYINGSADNGSQGISEPLSDTSGYNFILGNSYAYNAAMTGYLSGLYISDKVLSAAEVLILAQGTYPVQDSLFKLSWSNDLVISPVDNVLSETNEIRIKPLIENANGIVAANQQIVSSNLFGLSLPYHTNGISITNGQALFWDLLGVYKDYRDFHLVDYSYSSNIPKNWILVANSIPDVGALYGKKLYSVKGYESLSPFIWACSPSLPLCFFGSNILLWKIL